MEAPSQALANLLPVVEALKGKPYLREPLEALEALLVMPSSEAALRDLEAALARAVLALAAAEGHLPADLPESVKRVMALVASRRL